MATNYLSDVKPIWCPGCGDYGVHAALNKALMDLGIEKSKIAIVSGIGCSSAMPHTFSTYSIHGIHGRVLPVAMGVKLANDELTVIGVGGDGDDYGIGGNHFVHTARRNIDITYIVMDNQIYGLTTGQASPTTLMGTKTKSTPFGEIEEPVNPIAVAISAKATYVARGFSGDPMHLAELIENGIRHKGFAIIDALSPCVTFNTLNTYDWFRQRIYKLDSSYNPKDKLAAFQKAIETETTNWQKIPLGLIYEEEKPTYSELEPALKNGPLAKQPFPSKSNISDIIEEYA
ncbi:MAG: thiamine pyrophosphate-dependent enzyme [Candidatus Micrarchaeaceae archaeon]